MSILASIILGLVQGLTEFLPVSSDGHLAVAYRLLGMSPNLSFEVFLHGATLLAMVVYFRRDIVHLSSSLLPGNAHRTDDRRLVLWLIIGTGVAAVIALVLGRYLEALAENMFAVGLGFLGTSLLLVAAERLTTRVARVADPSRLTALGVAAVGVFQGLAALPGLSRSGSTIAGGMLFGLKRDEAARFSFLLGIPIIALASAKDAVDVLQGASHLPGTPVALALGFVAAGVSGYTAIWGLLKLVKTHSLYWFAAYTAVLGAILMITNTL